MEPRQSEEISEEKVAGETWSYDLNSRCDHIRDALQLRLSMIKSTTGEKTMAS